MLFFPVAVKSFVKTKPGISPPWLPPPQTAFPIQIKSKGVFTLYLTYGIYIYTYLILYIYILNIICMYYIVLYLINNIHLYILFIHHLSHPKFYPIISPYIVTIPSTTVPLTNAPPWTIRSLVNGRSKKRRASKHRVGG